jgi:hypothetical protein
MRSGRLFLQLLIFLVLVYSCAPAYVPNRVNAPLLTNKGEIQISASIGTSGFDPQIAYAVTNSIGLMANASVLDMSSDETSESDIYHSHIFFEFGPGYYRNLNRGFKFETFTGIGFGRINGEYENSLWTSNVDVKSKRYFLQPSFGYTSKLLDIGVSARLVVVSFDQNSEKNTGVLVEPALTAKLGWDHIKIIGQIGLAYPLNESDINFAYQPGLVSLGLQANFGKVFK